MWSRQTELHCLPLQCKQSRNGRARATNNNQNRATTSFIKTLWMTVSKSMFHYTWSWLFQKHAAPSIRCVGNPEHSGRPFVSSGQLSGCWGAKELRNGQGKQKLTFAKNVVMLVSRKSSAHVRILWDVWCLYFGTKVLFCGTDCRK